MSKKRKKVFVEASQGVEETLEEVRICREDLDRMFLEKWAMRGVTPVNGCIALAVALAKAARLMGSNKEEIFAMLDEVIDSVDEEMKN